MESKASHLNVRMKRNLSCFGYSLLVVGVYKPDQERFTSTSVPANELKPSIRLGSRSALFFRVAVFIVVKGLYLYLESSKEATDDSEKITPMNSPAFFSSPRYSSLRLFIMSSEIVVTLTVVQLDKLNVVVYIDC